VSSKFMSQPNRLRSGPRRPPNMISASALSPCTALGIKDISVDISAGYLFPVSLRPKTIRLTCFFDRHSSIALFLSTALPPLSLLCCRLSHPPARAMEPLVALGVAGNVVQFTQFAYQIVAGTVDKYKSASGDQADAQAIENTYTTLSKYHRAIQTWLQPPRPAQDGAVVSRYAADLTDLTVACKHDCEELIALMHRFRLPAGSRAPVWRAFQKAMLEMWKSSSVLHLKGRIRDAQSAITALLCAISRSAAPPWRSSLWTTLPCLRHHGLMRSHSENVEISMVRLRALEIGQETAHAQRTEQVDRLLSSLSETRDVVNTIKTRFGHVDHNFREIREVRLRRDAMISGRDERKVDDDELAPGAMGSDEKFLKSTLGPEDFAVLTNKVSKLSLKEKVFMREEAVLSSLNFEKRSIRHDHIPLAHRETFDWIFDKAATGDSGMEGRFARWLETGSGAFWITGKPGSGKSTLMKLIAKHLGRHNGTLAAWAGPKKLVLACHYFWSAGTAIQRSQEGLLRTVLFDILSQAPELVPKLCPERWEDAARERLQKPWALSELSAMLHQVTRLPSLPIRVCLLVDGLDEYEGVQDSLCREMLQLAALPDVKLCVSSRPWNVFEDYFGLNTAQKLAVHDLTRDDIAQYVQDRLQQHPRWGLVAVAGSLADDAAKLVGEITKRANGVFLWVHLVTGMLYDGLTNDDSVADLWKRLESIPTDLKQFFRHILEAVEPFYHQKMAGALLITLTAPGPLPVEVYCFHDMEYTDEEFALKQPIRPLTAEEMQSLRDPIERRLNAWCKGLLEVRGGNVEFLHRSVRDFLLTEAMMRFLGDQTADHFDPNLSPFRAYIAWIKSSKFNNVSNERLLREGDVFESFRRWGDTFRNTMGRALSLARAAVEEGGDRRRRCFELLDDLEFAVEVMALSDQLSGISALMKGSRDDKHRRARSLFREMLVLHDFGGYIAARMGDNPRYFADVEQPPLWVALQTLVTEVIEFYRGGSTRPDAPKAPPTCVTVVECLLQQGCSPNEDSIPRYPSPVEHELVPMRDPNITPWVELLSRFLGHGDNKPPDHSGINLTPHLQGAFSHILKSGVIELLLGSGVDCNARIWTGVADPVNDADNPSTITAAALFVLVPFFPKMNKQLPKSYIQILRTLLSGADLDALEESLFQPGPNGPGLLSCRISSLQVVVSANDAASTPLQALQRCAKTLCELARFDTKGLPWHTLEVVLETVFPKNLLEQIQDAIASRGCHSAGNSQLSLDGETTLGVKRRMEWSESDGSPCKRPDMREDASQSMGSDIMSQGRFPKSPDWTSHRY